MVEPVSMLGGVALGVAKAAIAKWVGGQIAGGIDLMLRTRELRQCRPSKDQQTELAQVIKSAVRLTAADLYPEDRAEQQRFVKRVCCGRRRTWPLVNGSDLDTLVSDMAAWIAKSDPQKAGEGAASDVALPPYLAVLCKHALAQFGFRAENNGMRNSILFPRWNRFCRDELCLGSLPATRAEVGKFENSFSGPVGTLIQGGTIAINTGHVKEPAPRWPRRLGALPPLTAARQDRPFDDDLAAALPDGGTTVVCQILVGGGGVGKTQAAAAYAHERWRRGEVALLAWVNAATRTSVVAAFAQAGAECCGADEEQGERAAERFLTWLDGPEVPRWLIVLDDLTETVDLHGLWPPANPQGRTIVTTRLREAALDGHGRIRIDVGAFTPEQARRYLSERLCERPEALGGADELAASLGFLPLGLAQAAAYLLDRPGLTCRDYAWLLAQRAQTLAGLAPRTFAADYPKSLDATLGLSIERADECAPSGLARAILGLASMLDSAGVPAELFTTISVRRHLAENLNASQPGEMVRPRLLPMRAIEDALAQLHRLSLIDHDGTILRTHALTQRACRDRFTALQREAMVKVSADALMGLWWWSEISLAESELLRANTVHLRSHAERALFREVVHPVLFRHERSLVDAGLIQEALAHAEEMLRLCTSSLGPDHPDTLTVRNNLASWRGEAGDVTGAAAAFATLIKDRLRILGPTHRHTMAARHNRAFWQAHAGEIPEAIRSLRSVLGDQIRELGPDDPDTLTTRSNLASWQQDTGDVTGAIEALEGLLENRVNALGPEHQDTFGTRSNLASARGQAGDAAGAVEAFTALLKDQLRTQGPDYPATLVTRLNLATWIGRAGDAAGAAGSFAVLLDDCLRVLGPDHPDTLITRGNLAAWRAESGDEDGVVEAFEALLQNQLRVLGPDHPDTFTTRNNLTYWLGYEAVAAFEVLLEDQLRVLGPDHRDTLTVRNNLAYERGEAGDETGAVAALSALLEDCLRVLGPYDPDTQATRENLAIWQEVLDSG